MELGEDQANELAYGALRDWSREVFAEVGSKKKRAVDSKFEAKCLKNWMPYLSIILNIKF